MEEMQTDAVSQAAQAMTDILKMAQAQTTGVAQKLIKMNAEYVIGVFQDEQMGKIIDRYV